MEIYKESNIITRYVFEMPDERISIYKFEAIHHLLNLKDGVTTFEIYTGQEIKIDDREYEIKNISIQQYAVNITTDGFTYNMDVWITVVAL